MNKLYADVYREIFTVVQPDTLSKCFTADKYITKIISRMIFKTKIKLYPYNLILLKKYYDKYDLDTADCIRTGNLYTTKWLYKKLKKFAPNTFSEAALYGNIENIEWLYDNNCELDEDTFVNAVKYNDFDNIKWLHSIGCEFSHFTFCQAINVGNFEIIKWLQENGCPYDNYTFSNACLKQDYKLMNWLKENNCPFGDYTLNSAIKSCSIGIIKWLIDNGCEGERCFDSALARDNNIEIMELLLEHKFEFSNLTFCNAVATKDIKILNWLHRNNCPFGPAFDNAVLLGNLNVMKWLKEHECPFTETTFRLAIQYGNIKNLQWLKDNGCPILIHRWIIEDTKDATLKKWLEDNIQITDNAEGIQFEINYDIMNDNNFHQHIGIVPGILVAESQQNTNKCCIIQ